MTLKTVKAEAVKDHKLTVCRKFKPDFNNRLNNRSIVLQTIVGNFVGNCRKFCLSCPPVRRWLDSALETVIVNIDYKLRL